MTSRSSKEDVDALMQMAEQRMADAEALLEIASAQLSVAARNIANANAAEREYRRAVWHYTQLMKHRISNPLQTIIGMAETLRDMPDLERSRRQAMIEAIGQQARILRDVSLEPRVVSESERALRPVPLDTAVRMQARVRSTDAPPAGPLPADAEPSRADREHGTDRSRSPFGRFWRNEATTDEDETPHEESEDTPRDD